MSRLDLGWEGLALVVRLVEEIGEKIASIFDTFSG